MQILLVKLSGTYIYHRSAQFLLSSCALQVTDDGRHQLKARDPARALISSAGRQATTPLPAHLPNERHPLAAFTVDELQRS